MLKIVLSFIFIYFFFYCLYVSGFLVINSKRAIMFVGSIKGKKSCHAKFISCSGSMKRVIRFKKDQIYQLKLNLELEKGDVQVKILNSLKQTVVTLNKNQMTANIEVDEKERYYLIFEFKSATGKYDFQWNSI